MLFIKECSSLPYFKSRQLRCSANATVTITIILIIKKSNNYFVTGDAAPDGGIVVNTPPGESF